MCSLGNNSLNCYLTELSGGLLSNLDTEPSPKAPRFGSQRAAGIPGSVFAIFWVYIRKPFHYLYLFSVLIHARFLHIVAKCIKILASKHLYNVYAIPKTFIHTRGYVNLLASTLLPYPYYVAAFERRAHRVAG